MSLWDAVSNGKINLKPFRNELRDFLQKHYEQSVKPQLSNKQLLQEEDTEILNQKEIKADSEDFPPTIYLSHAGLILVYPFIKELFKSCGLLSSSGDISHLNEAVHLLHYVATKNLNPAEYEVTLEKLLCGIPLQTPIEREVILKDSQILEAEEMLKAVSENWPAVKNSSPDALRNTFLIRDGKLEIINFDKRLIVQRKTEDILIDKIPWSISIVKTPWMKEFLTVEW
jgi:hypothetical protein